MRSPNYGVVEPVAPHLRRILAPNASPFTLDGTQTFIVGDGEVAVIDPGPDDQQHVDALLVGLAGEKVVAILCTHTHRDHSPAARLLKERTGAPVIGCAPLLAGAAGEPEDESFDREHAPDHVLADGEQVTGPGWTLQAVATPGHTSNHLCFAWAERDVLFSGDHVMAWSTTIVSPPDGDMGAYLASLGKLLGRADAIYYPTHGPAVNRPHPYVRALIGHRRMREQQILGRLQQGEGAIRNMVADLYRGTDPHLHPAAARSVLAHLVDLEARGLVGRSGDLWYLAA